MAKKGAADNDRYIVDAATIVMEKGNDIPVRVRGSKYPWEELLPDIENLNFFVPLPDEETANRLRTSIQQSGRDYYANRGFDLAPITRVVQNGKGQWGVRAWARSTEEAAADEEGDEE